MKWVDAIRDFFDPLKCSMCEGPVKRQQVNYVQGVNYKLPICPKCGQIWRTLAKMNTRSSHE